MTTNPVESTNIARIGWEDGTLLVIFRDGAMYQVEGVSADAFARLMAAESKGRHFALHFAPAAKKVPGTGNTAAQQVTTEKPGRPDQAEPAGLDTIEPDDCCAKPLAKAMAAAKSPARASGRWNCPKCGAAWRRIPVPNTGMHHWHPECDVMVFKS